MLSDVIYLCILLGVSTENVKNVSPHKLTKCSIFRQAVLQQYTQCLQFTIKNLKRQKGEVCGVYTTSGTNLLYLVAI